MFKSSMFIIVLGLKSVKQLCAYLPAFFPFSFNIIVGARCHLKANGLFFVRLISIQIQDMQFHRILLFFFLYHRYTFISGAYSINNSSMMIDLHHCHSNTTIVNVTTIATNAGFNDRMKSCDFHCCLNDTSIEIRKLHLHRLMMFGFF